MLEQFPTLRKLKSLSELAEWREHFTGSLAVVNGCFDVIHAGHLRLLEHARALADCLAVGINSDVAVRHLKGQGRPINYQLNRAAVISGFACVTLVTIFDDSTATEFLKTARPTIWLKGGDYTLQNINQDERRAVEAHHGRILFAPTLEGLSSTAILDKL